MRTREEIQADAHRVSVSYGAELAIEVLLDIRDQNQEIIQILNSMDR